MMKYEPVCIKKYLFTTRVSLYYFLEDQYDWKVLFVDNNNNFLCDVLILGRIRRD